MSTYLSPKVKSRNNNCGNNEGHHHQQANNIMNKTGYSCLSHSNNNLLLKPNFMMNMDEDVQNQSIFSQTATSMSQYDTQQPARSTTQLTDTPNNQPIGAGLQHSSFDRKGEASTSSKPNNNMMVKKGFDSHSGNNASGARPSQKKPMQSTSAIISPQPNQLKRKRSPLE